MKDLLKSSILFSELDNQALTDLQKIAVSRKYQKDDVIFSEGDKASSLHLLAKGSIDLVKYSFEGKQQLIRTIKEKEIFAEAAVFAGETYPVTAVATQNSEIISIKRADFVRFIRSKPDVAMQMLSTMARLLRHLNSVVTEMTLKSVPARLATFLLKRHAEVKSKVFEIGMPKIELSKKLGTIAATISRSFKKLKEEKIIKIDRDKITILDLESLKELAE